MIEDERYERIIKTAIECQNFDNPAVLIYLEKVDNDSDRLHYVSACNSAYEMTGMVAKVNSIVNALSVYDMDKEREDF